MNEEQFEKLLLALDEIANRIAPYKEFSVCHNLDLIREQLEDTNFCDNAGIVTALEDISTTIIRDCN